MANVKISELTAAASLTGTETIPVVQSATTKSATAQQIADLVDLSSYVPEARTLTINGTTYDLSANRTWTVSAGGNTNVDLVDGANIVWDFNDGNIANVTLGGNRALTILNVPDHSFGVLKITQDGTGSRTLDLPSGSQTSAGYDVDAGAGIVTLTAFYYDGTTFFWSSEVYSAGEEYIVWNQLSNTAYSADGNIVGTSTSVPAGGTASKKMALADGNWVQWTLDATSANNDGSSLVLCPDNDADYDWGDNTNNIIVAVNQFTGSYYVMTGNTNTVTSTITGAAASDIIRIEKSGNDAIIQKSINNGLSFSTIYTATGVFSGVTDCYVRAMFAVNSTTKIMRSARGKGLINI